jgi:hypothetical protein
MAESGSLADRKITCAALRPSQGRPPDRQSLGTATILRWNLRQNLRVRVFLARTWVSGFSSWVIVPRTSELSSRYYTGAWQGFTMHDLRPVDERDVGTPARYCS